MNIQANLETSFNKAREAGDIKKANSINWTYFCTFGKYLPE
jgi:hypothetical protein